MSHRERSDQCRRLRDIDDGTALLADLQAALGPERARAEPLELGLYARDAGVATGRAGAVCFPRNAHEVATIVQIAARHDRPFVARGSGTGLAGGATPVGEPVVIVTTQLNSIVEVDPLDRVAWVEPGVLNLDLSRAVAPLGLHYAPDPSSQQACTIGGNVATNAGGPHCLASGVTAAHVLAVDVVLADGATVRLGGLEPDRPGYDLRGCFVGSEGTMGIATQVAVRLTPNPPVVRTLLADFGSIDDAAATVSGIIAAGVVPAALEMMDAEITARSRTTWVRAIRVTPLRCSSSSSTVSRAARPLRSRPSARWRRRTARAPCAWRPTTRNARSSGGGASRPSARSHGSRPTTTSTTRSSHAPGSSTCYARSTRSRPNSD